MFRLPTSSRPALAALLFTLAALAACGDSGGNTTPTPDPETPTCSDGVFEGEEACDDGNDTDGDGCSSACAVEDGYTCTGTPSVCTPDEEPPPDPVCGDGAVEGDEACDDGNDLDDDGCTACAVDDGYTCAGSPSACTPIEEPPPVVCGDGVIEGDEACDDGDDASGDGCSSSCAVEDGFTCTGAPSVCTPIEEPERCGDGALDADEACDDGNTTDGDGCTACAVDTGFACDGAPSACAIACGDGILLGDEACDDGNDTDGDGCTACAVDTGYTCDGAPSTCATVCGDGIITGDEQCDDGNITADDGCTACAVDMGYTCGAEPSVCATICGDGAPLGSEQCDDGNDTDGDGCTSCAVDAGYTCDGAPSTCATVCGDGLVEGDEQCDDGNDADGDGCTSCATDAGYACDGAPSACATVCGDGLVTGAEACDDGNNLDGDGCTACAVDTGFACDGAPSACASICGDGLLAGAETCDDGNDTDGDGCTSCATDAGYACDGAPSVCATVCGDGLITGAEVCDDGNDTDSDGCTSCAVDVGYTCDGAPSACATLCGDGIVAGAETCDDGNSADGDGCTSCAPDAGYACSGAPSACVTVCGDGITTPDEGCDDGNDDNTDGCSDACAVATGDTCADPLGAWQLVEGEPLRTWVVPAGSVTNTAGAFTCDANTVGPDVVIAVEKTSPSVAEGGQLLRVTAAPTTATNTSSYLNVEVREGACEDTDAVRKCLWYKHDWDVILDGPAGTYYVFVAKNSPTTNTVPFPEVRVTAEEIDPEEAEGEGCFAPYTDASAIYTPPANVSSPHTWTLPATINSFDMGDTWGEPGSISCDNTSPYGDIHGVDAVIAYDKAFEESVLLVEVQNLASPLSASDLNVEILSVCDPTDPAKRSLQCRANADTHSVTAPAPAGPVYIWVSTEATGEEFGGATVQVTELELGAGESWPTAERLAGSAMVTPTSTRRLDAPTCLPAGANVHWYSVTAQAEALGVSSDGIFGVYDAEGQQLGCGSEPFGALGEAGETFYIALANEGVARTLELRHSAWDGVRSATELNGAWDGAISNRYTLAFEGEDTLYAAGTGDLLVLDLGAGSAAAAPGVNADALGYGLTLWNGSVFASDTTTNTSASRIFRLYNGTSWGVTAWDTGASYPSSSPTYSLVAYEGTLFYATRRTSASTNLYTLPTNTSATPTLLGTNTHIWYVVGLALDSSYLYLAGVTSQGEGIYRIPRGDLTAVPERLAALNTSTNTTPLVLDTTATPQILYTRDASGDLYAVADPAGDAIPTGLLYDAETSSSLGLTLDPATGVVYLVDVSRLIRLD